MYTLRPAVLADDKPAQAALACGGEARGVHHVCHDADGRVAAVLLFDAAAEYCEVSLEPGLRTQQVVAAAIDLAERLALEQTPKGLLTIGCMEGEELLDRWLLIRGYSRRPAAGSHRQQYRIDLATAPPGV